MFGFIKKVKLCTQKSCYLNLSFLDFEQENQEEECRTEGETIRSQSSRRTRAAAIHNQSERVIFLANL